MTPKQKAFVAEYLKDLNASAAARRAGYKGNRVGETAWENLKKPEIQKAIQEGMARRAEKLEITQDYVLSNLRKNLERSLQETPVTDNDGNPIGEYRYEGSVANKALELLGKHIGMFVDRTETRVDVQQKITLVTVQAIQAAAINGNGNGKATGTNGKTVKIIPMVNGNGTNGNNRNGNTPPPGTN